MHGCTFVISRFPRGSDELTNSFILNIEECQKFEDDIAAELKFDGSNVLIVPHIYYLVSSHPAVSRLVSMPTNIVLASWLHPRAAYWTLKAHGIDGDYAVLSENEVDKYDAMQNTSKEATNMLYRIGRDNGQGARAIYCYDMRSFSSVDACVREFRRFAELRRGDVVTAPQISTVEEVSDGISPQWYPVLDYSSCANCKQCLDFCLFDVYSLEAGQVIVNRPDNCKPGCPACARVCPQGAIMFPHYMSDPAISGAPGAKISDEPIDAASLCQNSERLIHKHQETMQPDVRTNMDSGGRCCSDVIGRDDLDDLIDALDALDD